MSDDPSAVTHGVRLRIARLFVEVIPWLGAAIALVEAGFIYYAFFVETPRANKMMKEIDVEMHCNQRWGELFRDKIEIEHLSKTYNKKEREEMVAQYYRQYWALQSDQFYYYEQGFLPDRIYLDWVYQRAKEFQHNDTVGNVTFEDGWEKYGRDSMIPSRDLKSFVEYIRAHKDDERFDFGDARVQLHRYKNAFKEDQADG